MYRKSKLQGGAGSLCYLQLYVYRVGTLQLYTAWSVCVCVCDDGRLRQSEHASLIFLDSSGDLANETKLKGAGA